MITEEKGNVGILKNHMIDGFYKSILVSIIESFADVKEKAQELGVKGSSSSAFKEEMLPLVTPFVNQIASKCEKIVSEKSLLDEDQELLVYFSAYCLASETLLEPTAYSKHVVDLIIQNLDMGRKKELSHRVVWFLDDLFNDDTWDALDLADELFYRIHFPDEKH